MATENCKNGFFSFGELSCGTPVKAARICNSCGASLIVLSYGATVQSLIVPDRNGNPVDVVLGYDTAEEYEKNDAYLGAVIGRVGNRISHATFSLNGKQYDLAVNDGVNHLHGGVKGFDKQIWELEIVSSDCGNAIICRRVSEDGEEGYPGRMDVQVTYTLTEDNALRIEYQAVSDKDTLVNLTNHSYFNLNGSGSILEHTMKVNAERFCENAPGCIPSGKLLYVEGTPFDFRNEKAIGQDITQEDEQLRVAGGYDHNFCLSGKCAAVVYSDKTGIEMTVMTDLPGVQVYSGNFLTERRGKGGTTIVHRGAICLETQLYPNAMECYGFPSPVLRAGKQLTTVTEYRFSVR